MKRTMCLMSLSEPACTVAAEAATTDKARAECHMLEMIRGEVR